MGGGETARMDYPELLSCVFACISEDIWVMSAIRRPTSSTFNCLPQGLRSSFVRVRVIAGRYGSDPRESAAARTCPQNPRENFQLNPGDPCLRYRTELRP